MKLGTQTGSFVNHLYSRMTNNAPQAVVGAEATLLAWSDRYPATVTKVEKINNKTYVTVKECKATIKNQDGLGIYGQQEYTYEEYPDGHGRESTFRERNGKWEQVYKNHQTGRWNKTDGYGLILGFREKYHDPSF